jgi:hypothetical protein
VDATIDSQCLCPSIETPARKALHHAEAAIEAVDHPLDQCIRRLFVCFPEADYVAFAAPFPLDRLKVFGIDPFGVTDVVAQYPRGPAPLDRSNHVLRANACPMNEAVPR